jgi:hypothetical protein
MSLGGNTSRTEEVFLTRRRFEAYRRICTELELFTPEALGGAEKELLRDVAEGLLLARTDTDGELDELGTKAAVALSHLVGLGRWSDAEADAMWQRLAACGPLPGSRARLARAVQHV